VLLSFQPRKFARPPCLCCHLKEIKKHQFGVESTGITSKQKLVPSVQQFLSWNMYTDGQMRSAFLLCAPCEEYSKTWMPIWLCARCMRAGVAQSVWCLTTHCTTRQPGFDHRQRQRIFLLTSVFRPALRPTQPPVQWVPWALSSGLKRGWDVTLTTYP
jgi:hypothetical protein